MSQFKTVLGMVFDKGLRIVVILASSYLAYKIGAFFLKRAIFLRIALKKEKDQSTQDFVARKRALTLSALLVNILKYFLFFLAGYLLLEEVFGPVRLVPLLAGAGVFGLAIGFGAQNLIKDVVAGFFILFEGWYAVGDFVRLKAGSFEAEGQVYEIGLRTTTVRDLAGNLHYIPNGSVQGVDKFPKGFQSFSLELVLPKMPAEKVLEAFERLEKDLTLPPLALSPFKNPAISPSGTEKILAKASANFVPASEEKAEEMAGLFVEELKKLLGIKEASYTISALDTRVLTKYKKSLPARAHKGK